LITDKKPFVINYVSSKCKQFQFKVEKKAPLQMSGIIENYVQEQINFTSI